MIKDVESVLVYSSENGKNEVHLVLFTQEIPSLNIDQRKALVVSSVNGSAGTFPETVEGVTEMVEVLFQAQKVQYSDIFGLSKAFVDFRTKAEKEKAKAEKEAKK